MIRKITVICLGVMAFLWCASASLCAQTGMPQKKLIVVTTLFPLYDFAREVGKEAIEVSLLLPPGMEAHSYEPTPQDIVTIQKADVFIFTGDAMEPWASGILKGVSGRALLIIDASKGIAVGRDPHIWLDFDNARIMVDTIARGFARKDQARAQMYFSNARGYGEKLAALDARFERSFAACRLKAFIYGGHGAFAYFARRYGLTCISPYRGFSPDAQPTPKEMAALIKSIRALKAGYIYYEELVDPKVARVIASETGAGLLLLDGAHNVSRDDFLRGVTFLDIMEEDLRVLIMGLQCQ